MNKKSLIYFLLIISCFSSFALKAQVKNQEYKLMLDSLYEHNVPLISVDELKKLNKQGVYLLDTREEEEFNVSHIKNARHVGYFWFDMRKVYDIPLDSKVILYCSVGFRSEKIARKLLDAGYKNVFNLYGSLFEWVNQGNPVYTNKGVQTAEIHTYNEEWARWVNRGTKVN
ncbi:rhodanese-like domain-containing protein [Daejeonella sp.]|jgi:rhodanese-related sulfurtransferase|uniref:rhodanese-like domain-containing protein n=1 Tax=Daejeonella sp. TaxID=2805397 RepID=UPI0037C1404F